VNLRGTTWKNDAERIAVCPKFELHSTEELAAIEAEFKQGAERMRRLVPLISRIKREHKGESWSGVERCPECGGVLHLRLSGYNGHMMGQCETKDCHNWRE
jgi:hypothetical protein